MPTLTFCSISGNSLHAIIAVPNTVADRKKPNCITLAGSKLVADKFEAKLHYAIWFEAGRRQVTIFEPASIMEFGREPASSC